jgi:hypothetical protein
MNLAIFFLPVLLSGAYYVLADARQSQSEPCYKSDCN